MLENAPYENEEDHAFNEFAFWRRPISVLNLNEGSGTDEFHYWHRRPSNLVGSFFDRSGEEHGGVSAESSASSASASTVHSPTGPPDEAPAPAPAVGL